MPYTAVVDIKGANTQFVDGQVTVGFGTNDITVSRVWVLSPTHLIANVVVAPGAAVGTSEISVISGFNVMIAPSPFQIQPANAALPTVGTVVNAGTLQPTLFPGAFGSVYGLNLAAASQQRAGNTERHAGRDSIRQRGAGELFVPSGFPIGPAVLNLNTGANSICRWSDGRQSSGGDSKRYQRNHVRRQLGERRRGILQSRRYGHCTGE